MNPATSTSFAIPMDVDSISDEDIFSRAQELQSSQQYSQRQSNTQFLRNLARSNNNGEKAESASEVENSPERPRRSQLIASSFIRRRNTIPSSDKLLFASPNLHEIDNHDFVEKFLTRSGFTTLEENHQQFSINSDTVTIVKRIQELLSSGDFPKEKLIRGWKIYLEDTENVKKVLEPTQITADQKFLGLSTGASVVRTLLQVPILQTEIFLSLFGKMCEAVTIADSIDDVRWTQSLLQQLRFLQGITDPSIVTIELEKLLDTSPLWFQHELIGVLPDIVTDPYHPRIAETLCALMREKNELTNIVLDCITNLNLGKNFLEEMREKVLEILAGDRCNISNTSEIIKFCVQDCPSIDVCQAMLEVIRGLEIQPLKGENFEEYFTCQMLTVQALKMSINMSKQMSNAALLVISRRTDCDPKPLDLIIMLLLCSGNNKKKAEIIMKKHIKSGYYDSNLLNEFYQNFIQVGKDLQPISLIESSMLLKSEDPTLVDFSSDWFREQFKVHGREGHIQQEIIRKIILLMGENDQSTRNALSVLRKMVETEKEKCYLQTHCNHLRILMDRISKFDLEEVGMLSDLLHALCTSSDTFSGSLQDDLFLLLQKQLLSSDILIKCKGVVGAVMAIKHLAQHGNTTKTAKELFKKLEKGVKNCPEAEVLFYDQFGEVVVNENEFLDHNFLKKTKEKFEDQFVNKCMCDAVKHDANFVSSFGLYGSEIGPKKNEFQVFFGEKKNGTIVAALFRLIQICCRHITGENLTELLSCPILMPKDFNIPDPRTLDMMFHGVNWCRELINAYATESNLVLKKQVLEQLDHLVDLQGKLWACLSLAESSYQPPPCYFHKIPPPPFVRVEMKLGKKSKQRDTTGNDATLDEEKENKNSRTETSSDSSDWQSWENGSLLCIKNPMYFRRLDASIAHLLEIVDDNVLSTGQICFLVKELISMLKDSVTPTKIFIRDLVKLLPQICGQLNHFVQEVRLQPDEGEGKKQTIMLLLNLLEAIFNWKGFNSPHQHEMLRDALKTLSGHIDKSNTCLESLKEMIAASYRYFESLADIATQITMAFALVKMCRTLMNHSISFHRQNKNRQSMLAFGFLCLEWPNDSHTVLSYKTALTGLLKIWMDSVPDTLNCISNVLEWLPREVDIMEQTKGNLDTMRAINRTHFHHLYQKLFDGTISGTKVSLSVSKTDQEKLGIWQQVGNFFQIFIGICEKMPTKNMLLMYLRYIPRFLKIFINLGIPVMEKNLRHHTDEIMKILRMIQGSTKFSNKVCCHSTETKDLALTKLVPAAKTIGEQFLFRVKGMLVANNSSTAFWMGNLKNKNLEGQELISQTPIGSEEQFVFDACNEQYSDDEEVSLDEEESDILISEDVG